MCSLVFVWYDRVMHMLVMSYARVDPTVTKCLSMSLSEIPGHFIPVVQKAHGNTRVNISI